MGRRICELFQLLCMMSCMLFITSCGEGKESYGEDEYPYLTISNNSGNSVIPASGGTITATIESNSDWRIYPDDIIMNVGSTGFQNASQYVQLSPLSGWGNSTLRITIKPTEFTRDICYYIYVTYNKESSQCLTIWQYGASGGDNTGGGNTDGGGDTGGGDTGGGNTTTKPSAPTNVYAENYGNATMPDVRISWASVTGATKYYVYRSTSANGSYSQLGSTTYTFYNDSNVQVGKTYYYKVKASNSAGMSDYSQYAEFVFKDTRKPGPVTYGNCSVSGTTMTLRWSVPTDASYGKPTKALLRVKSPNSDEYVTLQELSGTATYVSFTYTPWVHTSGYLEGYIYAGIILENENGTGGGTPKIWDNKNKKWMN